MNFFTSRVACCSGPRDRVRPEDVLRRSRFAYGTCRITVCDTEVVQNLYGAIQEYGAFDREEWLM